MDSISPNTPQKQCSKCLDFFPATPAYFNKHRLHKDGLASQCKKCRGNGTTLGIYKENEVRLHEKQCSDCLKWFPKTSDFFQVNRSLKDGFVSRCKPCQHRFRNSYYASKDESVKTREKQRMHQYYESHQEEAKRIGREYYANHQEHVRQDKKRYRKEHYDKMHSTESLERRNAYLQERNKRPEVQEHRRKLDRVYAHNRRSRKRSIPGNHTPEQLQEQLIRQKHKCYYCSKELEKVKENGKWKYIYEADHTFPISRVVGTDIPANDISYMVITCPFCNSSKKDKFPWEWHQGGRLL